MSRSWDLARSLFFRMDAERAHGLTIRALKHGLVPRRNIPIDPRLRVQVAGIAFPNPLGLAAGFDKNAEVPDAALRLGFGFVEVGTLTPLPQKGNPRPRLFRIPEARAVINRFGFNNEGHADAASRLEKRRRKAGLVGINVGANKDAPDRIADYVTGIHRFECMATYLTVNISSPNTPGLRKLQEGAELDKLFEAVIAAREGAAAIAAARPCPVFVKVAPDLTPADIGHIADAAMKHGIDGLIVSNTTVSRRGVGGRKHASEAGGLSGRPLMERSTYVLAAFRKAVGPNLPLIGVGGVEDAATAIAKIEAGADLVQFYTAMVYGGPDLPIRILEGMSRHLDKLGAPDIRSLRDTRVEDILKAGPPPGFLDAA
ncbi:quinone-dependent dihydroorotate dehydrogenase [Aureimonas populi]|uniref:Dihydroorotate dehydrogenase (quinone) n=1 Tax=Aureimonas populi TaxID=1701758 RepID=A0ABW5CKA8_9HYPH|nr:quinone-dependent dihydroorotate dehydrogenase [Aureimonas populi]